MKVFIEKFPGIQPYQRTVTKYSLIMLENKVYSENLRRHSTARALVSFEDRDEPKIVVFVKNVSF